VQELFVRHPTGRAPRAPSFRTRLADYYYP
jgi:hypothetical protein